VGLTKPEQGREQAAAGPVVDRFAKERRQLAAVEHEVDGLQVQYELAMSAFKFDNANALQRRIGALEAERRALAASLPSPASVTDPPVGVVPTLRPGPPRRLWRRR
jgi:hypothetical protein